MGKKAKTVAKPAVPEPVKEEEEEETQEVEEEMDTDSSGDEDEDIVKDEGKLKQSINSGIRLN